MAKEKTYQIETILAWIYISLLTLFFLIFWIYESINVYGYNFILGLILVLIPETFGQLFLLALLLFLLEVSIKAIKKKHKKKD
mgnify:CR=1 FL=1